MLTQSEGHAAPGGEPARGAAVKGRALRIRRSAEFAEIFRVGRKRVGRCMVLWARPSGGEFGRIGVVASKRTFPRAVDRSRAKRLMREAFRLEVGAFPSADVVCVARRSILNLRCGDVRGELLRLMRTATETK